MNFGAGLVVGVVLGALAVVFGAPALWRRLCGRAPTSRQCQLFLAVRASLDEARRLAKARGDDVTEARCAMLREATIEHVLTSEGTTDRWVTDISSLPTLGLHSVEEMMRDRIDLLTAEVRAIELAETLALSMRYRDRENRLA